MKQQSVTVRPHNFVAEAVHPTDRRPRSWPYGRAQGGKARAAKLSAKKRSAITKKGDQARWAARVKS